MNGVRWPHEGTLAIGMAIGTIVVGVLGSLAGQRVAYLSGSTWSGGRWVQPLRRRESKAASQMS